MYYFSKQKFLKSCLTSIVMLSLVLSFMLPAASAQAAPRSLAFIAIDAKTGKVLTHKASTEARHPASLTKMMTLYLLFDALDRGAIKMDTRLVVSQNAAAKPASKLYVSPGRPITVDTAIDALIIKSANDVATVVAENLAGSEAEFAVQMNSAAKQIGMYKTTFRNASGLHHDEQITTAYDMSLLALALQDRFPKLYKRFSKPRFRYGSKEYTEYNPMLGAVPGVDGLKTGFTKRSGFNLATSRRHNNKHIIAVVLGAGTSKERARKMSQVLAKAQETASAGSRKIAKLDRKIWTDPIQVSWKDGTPLAAFGTSPRPRSPSSPAPLRGKNVDLAMKPDGLHLLPEDFFARDQKVLAIMLRDLAKHPSVENTEESPSLFDEANLFGGMNKRAAGAARPSIIVSEDAYPGEVSQVTAQSTSDMDPSLYGQITKN